MTKQIAAMKKQKGLTLIELMIGLLISATLVMVAVSFFSNMQSSTNSSTEQQNVQAIYSKVKSMYSGRNTYTGLTTAAVKAANGFPASMVDGSGNVVNVWGGSVTVAPNATAGFDVTYPQVDQASCQELVNNVANTFYNVTVAGTKVKNNGTFNAATLATQCGAASSSSIVFNAL